MKKPYKLKYQDNIKDQPKNGFCIQEWEDRTMLKGKYIDNQLCGWAFIKTSDGKEFQGKLFNI